MLIRFLADHTGAMAGADDVDDHLTVLEHKFQWVRPPTHSPVRAVTRDGKVLLAIRAETLLPSK